MNTLPVLRAYSVCRGLRGLISLADNHPGARSFIDLTELAHTRIPFIHHSCLIYTFISYIAIYSSGLGLMRKSERDCNLKIATLACPENHPRGMLV
jgi:hypothetical protein